MELIYDDVIIFNPDTQKAKYVIVKKDGKMGVVNLLKHSTKLFIPIEYDIIIPYNDGSDVFMTELNGKMSFVRF